MNTSFSTRFNSNLFSLRDSMRTQAIINDFQNEFQMMRKLDHKNIVKLRGLSIPSGRLVMEYIELGSLFSWLCQKNKQVCDDYRAKLLLVYG